jgi:hypothetical protein
MNVLIDVLLGMAAPAVVVGATWTLMRRTYRRNPAALTRLMLQAFAGKMLFFGGYVALVLSALPVRPMPFIAAFTGSFVVLYALQALWLRHLLAGDARA